MKWRARLQRGLVSCSRLSKPCFGNFPVTCRDVFLFPGRLSGIATGAIYGLIAVGYSLTFMTTKALNFALGMWVMLGGMLTYSLLVLHGIHPLLVLPRLSWRYSCSGS